MLLGFSQGACLTLEFVARNARRYGGVVGLSGGLIGPDGMPRDYSGLLAGTLVFLGCSDVDFHVPKERVLLSAEVLERLGGDVTMRLYRGMGHTVNQDEITVIVVAVGLRRAESRGDIYELARKLVRVALKGSPSVSAQPTIPKRSLARRSRWLKRNAERSLEVRQRI